METVRCIIKRDSSKLMMIFHPYPSYIFQPLLVQVLTASILTGWSLLSLLLSQYTSLGYIKGLMGCTYPIPTSPATISLSQFGLASGLYALSFGLLGLLPAPRVRRH